MKPNRDTCEANAKEFAQQNLKKNEKPQRIQITVEEEKESEKLQGEYIRNTKPIKK